MRSGELFDEKTSLRIGLQVGGDRGKRGEFRKIIASDLLKIFGREIYYSFVKVTYERNLLERFFKVLLK